MTTDWHPRGEPTWPDWQKATAGTRVRHVRTGRTGTVHAVRTKPRAHHSHITIDWDDVGFGVVRGMVVAPAFDLEEIQ